MHGAAPPAPLHLWCFPQHGALVCHPRWASSIWLQPRARGSTVIRCTKIESQCACCVPMNAMAAPAPAQSGASLFLSDKVGL